MSEAVAGTWRARSSAERTRLANKWRAFKSPDAALFISCFTAASSLVTVFRRAVFVYDHFLA